MNDGSAGPQQPEPPARTPGVPADAPESLEVAARGGTVSPEGERDALSFLLGATTRPAARVRVDLWTPEGNMPLWFVLQAVDGRRRQELDDENRTGSGPFAKLDTPTFNAALLVEATREIQTESGRSVTPTSDAFIGGMPGGAVAAMEARFKYQPGLLDSLVEKVGELSAYSADRVGAAQRVLVDAVGNSSS